jgi:hypothetical protein
MAGIGKSGVLRQYTTLEMSFDLCLIGKQADGSQTRE